MELLDDKALNDLLASLNPDEIPPDPTGMYIDVPSKDEHNGEAPTTPDVEEGIWTRRDEETAKAYKAFEPANWNFNTVARLGKVGVELARLAAGLPTKNEQAVHFEIDVAKLTDDQIERIRGGEHPAAVVASANQGDPSPD